MLFLQILAIILALFGIVGSIVPALPGPPVGWFGMLCAYFCRGLDSDGEPMSLTCLFVWLGVTVIVTVLDYVVPAYMTKATGGHKAASWGATIGLFLGMFITPIGMILGSLLGAFLGELIFVDSSDTISSLKASLGAFLGFITGTFMKLVVSIAMTWLVVVYFI